MATTANQPVIIEARNVSKSVLHGQSNGWTILRSINLAIAPGEFVIVYGPSGSGKSTLLKIMAGLDRPTEGDILFRGDSLNEKSLDELALYRLEEIGVIFAQSNHLPQLTVRENVALPETLSGTPLRARITRANELLDQIGLQPFANYYPDELPSGARQKMVIIRALMKNPPLLLVNEPTRNLDTKTSREVLELFSDLNRSIGTSILMISQNPEHVYYPHRVIYLKDGTIDREVINRPLMVTNPIDPLPVANRI